MNNDSQFIFRVPAPHAPQFSLMSSVLTDGLSVAIVSYTITLSMALTFAQKLDYELDANQELLAMVSPTTISQMHMKLYLEDLTT